MSSKITIKGKTFKEFDVNLRDMLLDDRTKYEIVLHKLRSTKYTEENGFFPVSIDLIRIRTDMTDEQINKLDNEQIFGLAMELINLETKKK